MAIPLEVTLDRQGRTPYRLTEKLENLRFTTAAMGGFGDCSFNLPGPPAYWKRELPHGAILRLVLDTFVIWEGRIEDIDVHLRDNSTEVSCFGLARLLDDVSVRRIWSKRDMQWQTALGGFGKTYPFAGSGSIALADQNVTTGQFDASDLTKTGVRISGNSVAVVTSGGNGAEYRLPSGLTLQRAMATCTLTGANTGVGKIAGRVIMYAGGNTAAIDIAEFTASGSLNMVPSATTPDTIEFGSVNKAAGSTTPTATDTIDYTVIRLLGTALTEDVSGGLYGGSILNDLIALVPGLTIGIIETGSDFTIQSIERSVRDTCRSVVDEVASYHASREWRVWEDGRFDWKSVNADEPQWITTLSDLGSGSELTTTVEGLAKTAYVLYADVASELGAEQSSASTDQRNPFVKQGGTKDLIVSPGFPMTSASASQLAAKLIADQGSYPLVQGRLVLPATRTVKRASGSPLPAFMIRAGENIIVSDLPKSDLFSQGRDGESLFHIVSTEADLAAGTMVLEVEGQTRRSDVLLARLAAATRTLTG